MKLILAGITGRMGSEVARLVQEQPQYSLTALTRGGGDAQADFAAADAVIDFTLPEGLMPLLKRCVETNTPLVTGTTGLSAQQQAQVLAAAQRIPIVQSFNMSLGVNLLAALVEKAAAALDENFDIEIAELHHRHKKDAPSGTAKLLGNSAANGRGVTLPEPISTDRNGERKVGEIGFSVARGGGVIGDHTVMLLGENERLELTHRGHNRSTYAQGALKAAQWIQGKPARLYSMRDVLGV